MAGETPAVGSILCICDTPKEIKTELRLRRMLNSWITFRHTLPACAGKLPSYGTRTFCMRSRARTTPLSRGHQMHAQAACCRSSRKYRRCGIALPSPRSGGTKFVSRIVPLRSLSNCPARVRVCICLSQNSGEESLGILVPPRDIESGENWAVRLTYIEPRTTMRAASRSRPNSSAR